MSGQALQQSGDPILSAYGNYMMSPYANAFTYDQYQTLQQYPLGASTGSSQTLASMPTQQAQQPMQSPGNVPMMPQTAWWTDYYGPQSVPAPYMERLNRRFGWNPQGMAYSQPFVRQQPYYSPQGSYPATPGFRPYGG